MKKTSTSKAVTNVMTSALVLAATSAVYGQDAAKPAETAPEPERTGAAKFFADDVPNWINEGKFNLNVRLRYEYADTSTAEPSHAPTIRTKFGYTTGTYYGFQGMLEGENVSAIGNQNNYNDLQGSGAGKTPIADPATTEINQYWLSYTKWDTKIKGPRQQIVLDNARFVGDVIWRQNQQTYDAIYLSNNSLEDFAFQYAYLYQVNRIFGSNNDDAINNPIPALKGRWQSDSHIINAKWAGSPYANVVGYAYLLDFDTAPVNSTATYGGYVTGTAPITDDVSLTYRGEFAYQTDYGSSSLDFSTPYYHAVLDAKLFKRYTIGVGYEGLTADDNSTPANNKSFKTPLATLAKFNGWADVFLTTPPQGLRDLYVQFSANLPSNIPLNFVYHKFDSDKQSIDYGQEFDVWISKKFFKNWSALLKYAYFDGNSNLPNVQKLWAQVEFNY